VEAAVDDAELLLGYAARRAVKSTYQLQPILLARQARVRVVVGETKRVSAL
jgi:hypothetical protein